MEHDFLSKYTCTYKKNNDLSKEFKFKPSYLIAALK